MVSIWLVDGEARAGGPSGPRPPREREGLAALERPAPGLPLAQGALKASMPGFLSISENSHCPGPSGHLFS